LSKVNFVEVVLAFNSIEVLAVHVVNGIILYTEELHVIDYISSIFHFCRAMLCISAAYAVVRCPSVSPSITFMDSVKTNKYIFKIVSPLGSHTILVCPYRRSWQYFDGDPLKWGIECRWVGKNRDSQRISGYWIDDWWSAKNNCDGPPCSLLHRRPRVSILFIIASMDDLQRGREENRIYFYAAGNLKQNYL